MIRRAEALLNYASDIKPMIQQIPKFFRKGINSVFKTEEILAIEEYLDWKGVKYVAPED